MTSRENAAARQLGRTLSALADPTRRRVVELLRERPRRAGELAAAFDASAPAMSRHLRVLRTRGLVEEERDAEKTTLQNALTKTDREIDQLVYQLYGLTPEEIALVEGAGNPAPAVEAD